MINTPSSSPARAFTPEATIFQFALCMLFYNMIQLVRAYVAMGQQRDPSGVSSEKLFADVQRELIAWHVVLTPEQTAALIQSPHPLG